ncbi:BrnT family toxin [Nitrospirillum sp. BR 11163]|uniref:BrnT family toxin n=1 Tax=Nitrospirillum sp. BR 11163 TaxID=3104323 RepID=UPI003A4C728B
MEWDAMKAASNYRKHGITFEMAMRAFDDPFVLMRQDRIEGGEMRWQTLGMVAGHLLLLVAHTLWEEDEQGQTIEVVRIISARRATRMERYQYEHEDR